MTITLRAEGRFTAKPQAARSSAMIPNMINNPDARGIEILRSRAIEMIASIRKDAMASEMGDEMVTMGKNLPGRRHRGKTSRFNFINGDRNA
jgi:hypothetical protein